jgi:hypothetical protein
MIGNSMLCVDDRKSELLYICCMYYTGTSLLTISTRTGPPEEWHWNGFKSILLKPVLLLDSASRRYNGSIIV